MCQFPAEAPPSRAPFSNKTPKTSLCFLRYLCYAICNSRKTVIRFSRIFRPLQPIRTRSSPFPTTPPSQTAAPPQGTPPSLSRSTSPGCLTLSMRAAPAASPSRSGPLCFFPGHRPLFSGLRTSCTETGILTPVRYVVRQSIQFAESAPQPGKIRLGAAGTMRRRPDSPCAPRPRYVTFPLHFPISPCGRRGSLL